MPTVVIIHAAEDALPARALAEKLRAIKLTPVIETPPGEALRAAVRDAAVTLALWSPRSVGQQPLIDEAAHARGKSKVVHARMQNAATPHQFGNELSIDLTGWRGEDEFPGWRQLATAVAEKAGVAPPAAPEPRPPSGFFQPGVPGATGAPAPQQARAPQAAQPRTVQPQQAQRPNPPPQRAAAPPPPPRHAPPPRPAPDVDEPRAGGGKGMMIVIGLLVLVGAGVGGYFVWNNMQGGQATAGAWESVERNNAGALRAFIDGDPGQYRDDAEEALAALEEQSFDAAREEDTIDGFEAFLNDFPDSDHAIEARGRIAELNSLPPGEEAPAEGVLPAEEGVLTDPDLLPPAASEPAPDAPGGPAQLTPAPPEPTPEPTPSPSPDLPVN